MVEPISIKRWLLLQFVAKLPVVGFIVLIVWMAFHENAEVRVWACAAFISRVIRLMVSAVIFAIVAAQVISGGMSI